MIFPLVIGGEILRRKNVSSIVALIGLFGIGTYSIAFAVFLWAYIAMAIGLNKPIVTVSALIVTLILAFLAWFTHKKGPAVIPVNLEKHPAFASLNESVKIVHLTDIHLTQHTHKSWVQDVVDQTNSLNPDIILFTGDLIDCDPHYIPELTGILKHLKAKHGKFAVSGNHDFMTGIGLFNDLCKQLGFTVLDYQSVTCCGIQFIGQPDEMAPGFGFSIPKLSDIHLSKTEPVIFLKHRPTDFEKAVKLGVHLQLSGHSHKGQLPPWGSLVKLRYKKYAYGLHHYKNGVIYTSRGTGVWGPPMRLFRQSEIVEIVLKK